MKLRTMKRRVIARMLSCEVVTFNWAAFDPSGEMERLINNHNKLINLLRTSIDVEKFLTLSVAEPA